MNFVEKKGMVVPSWVLWTLLIALVSTSGTAIYSSARMVSKVEFILSEHKDMKLDISKNSDRIFDLTGN